MFAKEMQTSFEDPDFYVVEECDAKNIQGKQI
jgi:hypothetical protein